MTGTLLYNQVKAKVTTPPAGLVISVSDVKEHIVVETHEEDDLIERFIEMATDYAERYTGRRFLSTGVTYYLDQLPNSDNVAIELPAHNVSAVSSVQYKSSGSLTTWASSNYYIDEHAASLRVLPVSSWPSIDKRGFNNVQITLVDGYGLAADVPDAIKTGIVLIVGDLYRNRENTVVGTIAAELPMGAKTFLDKYRVVYRNDYGLQSSQGAY